MSTRKKIYGFEIVIGIIILITKLLIRKSPHDGILFATITFLILGTIMYKILGVKKENKNIKQITTELIIIIILGYLIFSIIIGLLIGFSKNPLSLTLPLIIKNTYLPIILIISEEYIRYIIAKKSSKDKSPLIIITILLIILDIILQLNNHKYTNYTFFIELTTILLPMIARHILLSYITLHTAPTPGIILRGFYTLKPYIFPIYTNYSDYITSIINIIIPYMAYILIQKNITHYEKTKTKKIPSKKILYLKIPLSIVSILLVILISGMFKYQIIAIGSGSMEPKISYGDAIIFKKITSREDYYQLKKGDIIIFQHDNKRIVHRIVNISYNNKEIEVQTKGDANEKKDSYKLSKKEIEGIYKVRIKLIGIPTLWFKNLLEK